MSTLNGIFSLRTPRDLLTKLKSDFERLIAADANSSVAHYAAFDFFVTAEHLADWQSKATGQSITTCRKYPDGTIVSHIASGAKHFHVTDPRHTSVANTRVRKGFFDPKLFDPAIFDTRSTLEVEMEGGGAENVVVLATRVLQHWSSVIK